MTTAVYIHELQPMDHSPRYVPYPSLEEPALENPAQVPFSCESFNNDQIPGASTEFTLEQHLFHPDRVLDANGVELFHMKKGPFSDRRRIIDSRTQQVVAGTHQRFSIKGKHDISIGGMPFGSLVHELKLWGQRAKLDTADGTIIVDVDWTGYKLVLTREGALIAQVRYRDCEYKIQMAADEDILLIVAIIATWFDK